MVGDIFQPTHLLFVLVVALLVLGPKRLPEVGRTLGSGIRDFRQALSGEPSERSQHSVSSEATEFAHHPGGGDAEWDHENAAEVEWPDADAEAPSFDEPVTTAMSTGATDAPHTDETQRAVDTRATAETHRAVDSPHAAETGNPLDSLYFAGENHGSSEPAADQRD